MKFRMPTGASTGSIFFRAVRILLLLAALAVPSPAFCELYQFVPKLYSSEWELYVEMAHERNSNTLGGKGVDTAATALTQRLVLTTTGIVYHPRFIQWLAKVGGGLDEHRFSSDVSSRDESWRTSGVLEYELRAVALPEHPYNLELYTLRRSPFARSRFGGDLRLTDTESGGILKYKQKPWRGSLSYVSTTLESGLFTTETRSLLANAGYAKEWFSASLAYNRSESSTDFSSSTTDFTSDYYAFENQLSLPKGGGNLVSNVSLNDFRQTGPRLSLDTRRFNWGEQLFVELPAGFSMSAGFNHNRDDEKSRQDDGPEQERRIESSSLSLGLTHRLYESLTTTYAHNRLWSSSSTGDIETASHAVGANYVKRIPGGRLLAGATADRITVERTGHAATVSEPHGAAIFGEFFLDRPFVDDASISLRVKAPLSGVFIPMIRGVHYITGLLGRRVRIRILGVPPDAAVADPAFVYDFQAAYNVVTGDVRLVQKDYGFNLRLQLFDNLLQPYYAYHRTEQDIESGELPGGGEDATTETVGIEMEKLPFTLLAEYQDYRSRLNPTRTYKGEARFRKDITESANLSARGFYTKVRHLESDVNPGLSDVTEDVAGGDIALTKRFQRNLNVSASVGYSHRTGVLDTTAYTLNGFLSWAYGKLELNVQASLSRFDADLRESRQTTIYQFYYLLLRRKLT